MATEVKTIDRLERLRVSGHGNPRFKVYFTDGTEAITQTDGQVNYRIENRENLGVPLEVEFTPGGRIKAVKPVKG